MSDEMSFTGFAHCPRCGDVIPSFRRLCNDCRQIAGVGENKIEPEIAGQSTTTGDAVRSYGDGTVQGEHPTKDEVRKAEPWSYNIGYLRAIDDAAEYILHQAGGWENEDIENAMINIASKIRRLKENV